MFQAQTSVADFMEQIADQPVRYIPTAIEYDEIRARIKLINEEFVELIEAMWKLPPKSTGPYHADRMVQIADGLGDLMYVVLGTACAYGIDLELVFDEIHRSNMTKVGGHKDVNGKWIKPDTYSPPDLRSVLWPNIYPPSTPQK